MPKDCNSSCSNSPQSAKSQDSTSRSAFVLDVLAAIFRLDDMWDSAQIFTALTPVLYRRCARKTYEECPTITTWIVDRVQQPVQPDLIAIAGIVFDRAGRCIEIFSNREGIDHSELSHEDILEAINEWEVQHLKIKDLCNWPDIETLGFVSNLTVNNGSWDITEIGRYQLRKDGQALIFLMLRSLREYNGKKPVVTHCDRCIECTAETYLISRNVQSIFRDVPEFLTRFKDTGSRIPADSSDEIDTQIIDSLRQIRSEISVADHCIRRWHHFLANSQSSLGLPDPYAWVLDSTAFPQDVLFNVCIPHVPRILGQATAVALGKTREDPEGYALNKTDKEMLLTYCLLFPQSYMNYNESSHCNVQFAPLEQGNGEAKGKTRLSIMKEADGGLALEKWMRRCRKQRTVKADNDKSGRVHSHFILEKKDDENSPWGNILPTTWAGQSMMHTHGPFFFDPKSIPDGRKAEGKYPLPDPIKEFDKNCLPRKSVIFPVRNSDEQQVGFGLCLISPKSPLVLGCSEEENRYERLYKIHEYTIRGYSSIYGNDFSIGFNVNFAFNIVSPELDRIATNLLVLTTGLSLSLVAAARKMICQESRLVFPPAFEKSLSNALFATLMVEPADHDDRPQIRRHRGLPALSAIAQAETHRNSELARQLQTLSVLSDLIHEFGHSFGKHSLGTYHYHEVRLDRAQIDKLKVICSTAIGIEDNELQRRLGDELNRWHRLRMLRCMEHVRWRMAAAQSVLALSGDEARKGVRSSGKTTAPKKRLEDNVQTEDVVIGRIFDYFSTLPGHRMWTRTTVPTLEHLEAIYWSRLSISAYRANWHPFRPFFRNVLHGAIETVLDTLIHNAFKHAPRADGTADSVTADTEKRVRVHVGLYQDWIRKGTQVAAIVVSDNSPIGIKDSRLERHIIGSGENPEPLPYDAFHGTEYGAGEESGKGQGIRTMMRCLEAQETSLPKGNKELNALKLYLLSWNLINDKIDHPDAVVFEEDSEHARALNLVVEQVAEEHRRNLDCCRSQGKVDKNRVAFVLMQISEWTSQKEYQVPHLDDIMILDKSPNNEDRDIYKKLLDGGDEEVFSDDYEKALEGHTRLPDAIIVHSAKAMQDGQKLKSFLAVCADKYDSVSQIPWIWMISEDADLYGLALLRGHLGSRHEHFRNIVQSLPSYGTQSKSQLRWELIEYITGPGRARKTLTIMMSARDALIRRVDRTASHKSNETLGMISMLLDVWGSFNNMEVPIEPSLRWWLTSPMWKLVELDHKNISKEYTVQNETAEDELALRLSDSNPLLLDRLNQDIKEMLEIAYS